MTDAAPTGRALWVAGARPRTLPAAVVPVAVGAACAVGESDGTAWWRAGFALVVALALQVGVNYANDYSDGVRGTDDERRVGPLRLVGSGLVPASAVKRAATLSFAAQYAPEETVEGPWKNPMFPGLANPLTTAKSTLSTLTLITGVSVSF